MKNGYLKNCTMYLFGEKCVCFDTTLTFQFQFLLNILLSRKQLRIFLVKSELNFITFGVFFKWDFATGSPNVRYI